MNKTFTEEQVLKKLGIPDFRHMTKDKIVSFVSVLPYMDPEVAKKALDQFPDFKDLAVTMITEYKMTIENLISDNRSSQSAVYEICKSILDSLREELSADNLTQEDKSRIEDKMIEVAQIMAEKDSENKRFLVKVLIIASIAVSGIVGAAAAILGSNMDIDNVFRRRFEKGWMLAILAFGILPLHSLIS